MDVVTVLLLVPGLLGAVFTKQVLFFSETHVRVGRLVSTIYGVALKRRVTPVVTIFRGDGTEVSDGILRALALEDVYRLALRLGETVFNRFRKEGHASFTGCLSQKVPSLFPVSIILLTIASNHLVSMRRSVPDLLATYENCVLSPMNRVYGSKVIYCRCIATKVEVVLHHLAAFEVVTFILLLLLIKKIEAVRVWS